MPHIYKKNVQPEDLTRAKVIGITLTTPGDKEGPIHKITFDMKGRVTHQENTPKWGEEYLTFPPAFKDLNAVAEWSRNLLKDVYGCGDIIEQRVCVLELYTIKEISRALDIEMFEDIKKDLFERMSGVTDSRQPTGDDIRIAWLVAKVDDLTEETDKLNKTVKAQVISLSNMGELPNTLEYIPKTVLRQQPAKLWVHKKESR